MTWVHTWASGRPSLWYGATLGRILDSSVTARFVQGNAGRNLPLGIGFVSFEELKRALSYGATGLSYSWAEKLWNAVQCGDECKLLDELESARFLESTEIANLFGVPEELLPPDVSPLDLVIAVRTLVRLNGFRTRVTRRMPPSWEEIALRFSVGSTHRGTIVRASDRGYIVSLYNDVPALLPTCDLINFPTDGLFCVTALDRERRSIIVALA